MSNDIPEYSSATVQVQRSSFKRLHPDIPSDAILNDKDILSWMGNAPALIVDYEGYLPNEDKKGYDRRREMREVYQGNIDNLTEYLRSIYTDRGGHPKTEPRAEKALDRRPPDWPPRRLFPAIRYGHRPQRKHQRKGW